MFGLSVRVKTWTLLTNQHHFCFTVGLASRSYVVFKVEVDETDVAAYESVCINGEVRRFFTSGGYSHFAEKSIIRALVPSKDATETL